MKQHTELEEKLFKYILLLIGFQNAYEKMISMIYNALNNVGDWSSKNWEYMDRDYKYNCMIVDLNQEFEWNLEVNSLQISDIKEQDGYQSDRKI